jgi:nucleoside-diphosphate-sugar epimerase
MSVVIVLGGVGFIGKQVVTYLATNKLATKIVVADKVLPEVAGLSAAESAIYKSDLVKFVQVNLAREQTSQKVYDAAGAPVDYVINLAAVTKYSQAPEVYKENIIEVAKTCAAAAAKNKVKRFVHVSTGQVYEDGKEAKEDAKKLKPWTSLAEASVEGEKAVQGTAGLNFVIVRPAIVYGPGDTQGITPRIICGAVYQKIAEKMEFLWDKDLRINTVHVRDVAKALWFLTTNGNSGDVFNLADEGDSNQGSISAIVAEMFGIKYDFMGNIKSKLATSIAMKAVAETANDKHLQPWSQLCKDHKIIDTPLTPYLDEELLYNTSLYINGKKITGLGFKYDNPKVTSALLKEVVTDFEAKNYFPKGVAK